jgi:hypothetical protein
LRPAVAALALALATSACGQAPLPKDVQAVIDRSHDSRANYAVISRVDVVHSGGRSNEVNAEFQQGAMHRVEVPTRRVLANCDTGEGAVYDVANARFVDEPGNVKGACGVAVAADTIVSARMLPPLSGSFGRADRIELTGAKFVRHYAVTPDGIIVSSDYLPQDGDADFSIKTISSVVKRGPQSAAMFTRDSLTRDFASEALAASASR